MAKHEPSIEERLASLRYRIALTTFVVEAQRDDLAPCELDVDVWAGVVEVLRQAEEHVEHLSSLPAEILNQAGKGGR